MKEEKQISIAQMCRTHQLLLVEQTNYSEKDPWRALMIATQIALFQAAMAHSKTHELLNGDLTKLGALGCLACYRPDAFGEIVEAGKSHDIGQIKKLGEKWVQIKVSQ